MIICAIDNSPGLGPIPRFWEGVFYTAKRAPPRAFKLCTNSVDNVVEKDLRRVASRCTRYSEVILVKKPSKTDFPQAYQFRAPLYDDGARESNDNQSRASG
jgi:hypothetical protein